MDWHCRRPPARRTDGGEVGRMVSGPPGGPVHPDYIQAPDQSLNRPTISSRYLINNPLGLSARDPSVVGNALGYNGNSEVTLPQWVPGTNSQVVAFPDATAPMIDALSTVSPHAATSSWTHFLPVPGTCIMWIYRQRCRLGLAWRILQNASRSPRSPC